MDIGVFIPIGNNGWLISKTSPQYKPSFDLNKEIVLKGLGDSADLGVLTPGVYFMIYERKDGKAMIDRFEVKKK